MGSVLLAKVDLLKALVLNSSLLAGMTLLEVMMSWLFICIRLIGIRCILLFLMCCVI